MVDLVTMVGLVGLMVIDVSVGSVTVTLVVAVAPMKPAGMGAGALPTPVTMPFETVAMVMSEDDQVALRVTFWEVLSEKVVLAVSGVVVPLASDGLGGEMVRLVTLLPETTTVNEPETEPSEAPILALPCA